MRRPVARRTQLLPPGASAARPGASARQGSLRRIATARPRPLTLPQSRAPKLLPRACRAARPLSSSPPPLEEEEKAPASASERAQAFISNLTVADAARYGTYAAGGLGVYMVSKGVLGTINTLAEHRHRGGDHKPTIRSLDVVRALKHVGKPIFGVKAGVGAFEA